MTTATTKGAIDPYADPGTASRTAVKALIMLLITFIMGTLCLQGFNLVFVQIGADVGAADQASLVQIGADVGAADQASLITAIPSIVLGIVSFIYGSLSDFVSLRRMVVFGVLTLFVGSVFGFVASYFINGGLWVVIIARMLQTIGGQVAGSVYLVMATKYLATHLKVIFFGLFTAGYQLSAAIGVFAAGLLSSVAWQYLFLIPAVSIVFLPFLMKFLMKWLPGHGTSGDRIDWVGFTVFGVAVAFLTLFFSYMSWWMLIVAAVLFIAFGIYIAKARNPFITPSFFKNVRWLPATRSSRRRSSRTCAGSSRSA